MDLTITRKNEGERYPQLSDGAYACFEGDQLFISVTGDDFADLEVEGCIVSSKTVTRHGTAFTTKWQFSPATFAGRTCLFLTCGDQSRSVELDVAPSESKLGRDVFLDLLDELERLVPGLPWGTSPGQLRGSLNKPSAMIIRPRAVDDMLPALNSALASLRSDPLLRSEKKRSTVRMAYNRQPDITTVRRLASNPLASIARISLVRSGETSAPPVNIDQMVTEVSPNHPITRYLVWLLNQLSRDLKRLKLYLERVNGEGVEGIRDDDRTYCGRLAKRLQPSIELIQESLRRFPLNAVSPQPFCESAAQGLMDHPASLRVHRIARRMLAGGLSPSRDEGVLAGLRTTCDLYEYLVLFRLAESLAQYLGTDWVWHAPTPPRIALLSEAPSEGHVTARQGGKSIHLMTQQMFRRTSAADMSSGMLSLSEKRSPDFIIGIQDDRTRELRSWLVLDAKFRVRAPFVRQSLEKMHVYRDGLRWNGQPPAGAYAVIPRLSDATQLYASDDYRNRHRFGVLCCPLTPSDEWLNPVKEWLNRELDS